MKHLTLAAVFALSMSAAAPAMAWGPEGHTIVGRIASKGLTPQAATDLQWIVSVGVPALNAQVQQTYGMKCQIDPADPWGPVPDYHVDHDQHTNLANWADCYRVQDASTALWHFDDIPLGDSPSGPLDAVHQPWCDQATACVTIALATNLRQLATPGLSPADAARALAYVVHFVGDAHQPLHAETNGDTGGNDVLILTNGSGVSSPKLHELWDTPLVVYALGPDLDGATQKLEADVSAEPSVNYASADETIAAADTWVEEAHSLAKPAYALLNIPVGAGHLKNVTVSHDYVATEAPVAEHQLALAAVRLRAALNAALTWSPRSP